MWFVFTISIHLRDALGTAHICLTCERCDMSSINKRSTRVVATLKKYPKRLEGQKNQAYSNSRRFPSFFHSSGTKSFVASSDNVSLVKVMKQSLAWLKKKITQQENCDSVPSKRFLVVVTKNRRLKNLMSEIHGRQRSSTFLALSWCVLDARWFFSQPLIALALRWLFWNDFYHELMIEMITFNFQKYLVNLFITKYLGYLSFLLERVKRVWRL